MSAGIWAKAACYMGPLFIAPFLDKCGEYLLNGQWPSGQLIVYCTGYGFLQMLIGGRAFFDGSSERDKQVKASDLEPATEQPKTP